MDPSFRSREDLTKKLDKMQDEVLGHFSRLVFLAEVDKKDRSATAVTEYQIKTETSALIKATEDVQTLIRQMQEMWLFGELDTLGESQVQQQTDENARAVAELLKQLTEKGIVGGEGTGS